MALLKLNGSISFKLSLNYIDNVKFDEIKILSEKPLIMQKLDICFKTHLEMIFFRFFRKLWGTYISVNDVKYP